jgi:aspartyl-tRNA(Asn)/glutamyl-tRNA(Gln) amidotransferase subunit B
MTEFEAVIGLETHIQLNTQSKIFCACKADSWIDPPNTNICPICTGLPGVLPTLNRQVVDKAARLAAAMNVQAIQASSYFARKNYFYPDLPKGYQISQYDEPLALGGYFEVPLTDGRIRRVEIIKLHIEEDAGKTVYQNGQRLIDFNRCGVPLVELVTGPDLQTADEAAQFLIRLRQLLRWLEISDADMERGQLRCDANVSIREPGQTHLNVKTEIKNVNSIANVRQAIEAEFARQTKQVEAGKEIQPWTLDWDDERAVLSKMRSKETEADYRYFREPDLLPIHFDEQRLGAVSDQLPELPLARRQRITVEYSLPEYDAEILTEERNLSDYFEAAVKAYAGEPKRISNWVINDLVRILREAQITAEALPITPEHLAEIVLMVDRGEISSTVGKDLLERVDSEERTPRQLVEAEGLGQVADEASLRRLASEIIAKNPAQVETYRSGKTGLLGWFIGQVMQQTQGKADAKAMGEIFRELLDQS